MRLNQSGADRAETSLRLFGRRRQAAIHRGEGQGMKGKGKKSNTKSVGPIGYVPNVKVFENKQR